jgi:APA family basic amino acid/polyamine antiporter
MEGSDKKIGLITATSLVVGNMIGAGIYLLPASLAIYGGISILGWLFTAAGALILAKIFSNFSKILVNKSGGPYTYSKAGFGGFIGFVVAWGYWISCWVSNAGITIAIIGALSVFFPILNSNPFIAVAVGLGMIWFFTWINSKGVKTSGKIQVITTVLKIAPLVFVIFVGVFFFNLDNFPEFNLTEKSDFETFPIVAALTLYAFLGIESATIPAENVKNPRKNIPRATMIGTILVSVIYLVGTVVLFGVLPNDTMQISVAPFADVAELVSGSYARYFVAAGAAISAMGCLNGWILLTGQLPMATAQDDMFPKVFKIKNKSGAPIFGLIIGSILTSVLLVLNFTEGLLDQFTFIVNLTVLTALIPYLFVAASYIIILINKKIHINSFIKTFTLGSLGFAYSLWAIYGSGSETVFYGLMLLLLGIPFYVLMQWNKNRE